jgi:hypothetical protein
MDDRAKAIRLLIAGGIFLLAGLNMWRKDWFVHPVTGTIAGVILLGGVGCLVAGGLLMSKDGF